MCREAQHNIGDHGEDECTWHVASHIMPDPAATRCWWSPTRELLELVESLELYEFEPVPEDVLDNDDRLSEWSVVTPAESTWTVEWLVVDEDVGKLRAWPADTASDELIAWQLQADEHNELKQMSSGVMRFPIASRARRNTHHMAQLGREVIDSLVTRLGICVVCSESVATVLIEPCGHLAICGACHKAWGNNTCVICRTPGVRHHLLSHVDSHGLLFTHATCIGLNDGVIQLPDATPEPPRTSQKSKLELRREMRAITRQARMLVSTGNSLQAGGIHTRRARAAELRQTMEQYERSVTTWRAQAKWCRELLRQKPKDRPVEPRYWKYHSRSMLLLSRRVDQHAIMPRPDLLLPDHSYYRGVRRVRACPIPTGPSHWRPDGRVPKSPAFDASQKKKAIKASAIAEAQHRAYERQAYKEQLVFARVQAEAAVGTALEVACSVIECASCNEAEACMMHLPCRHVALCRGCWDAGTRAGEICARCGAASRFALCVHKP